jgi:polysaccharide biosynthesis transport protein
MLKETRRQDLRMSGAFPDREGPDVLAVSPRLISVVRHKRLVVLVTACFVLLAALFSLFRGDSYTAVTKLLIDNKSLQLGRQDAVFARSEVDVPLIQNQIELLRSETIANQVIDVFKLTEDREFTSKRFGLFTSSADEEAQRRQALDSFKRRLYVGRVGDSYTLEIRFTASSPQQASDIANRIGTEYVGLVARSNAKVAQSASLWLRARLVDMGPNATVITEATPPIRKDGPGSIVLLCAALLVGLMFGTTGAFAVDVMDRTIRTQSQASAVTGTECFGIAPLTAGRNATGEAIRNPRSFFAHTLRRSLAAIREQSDTKTIGVTSMLPNEGKTEIAANLAQLAASSGSRVLLVDAATNSGRLSRLLAPDAQAGLIELLGKKTSWSKVLRATSNPNLRFLSLGQLPRASADPAITLAGLHHVLSEATALFDLIVVDLPAATLMADVRESAVAFDGMLLVIEWGRTSLDVLGSAMISQQELMQKVLGTILNKVDVEQLKTYDPAFSAFFEHRKLVSSAERPPRPAWLTKRFSWLDRWRSNEEGKR